MQNLKQTGLATALTILPLLGHASAQVITSGNAGDKATWNKKIANCRSTSAFFKKWYDALDKGPKKIPVILVRNKRNVIVDNFATLEVDLTDLDKFPAQDPPMVSDQCQLIIHFLQERLYASCHPKQGFPKAHQSGLDKEKEYRDFHNYGNWVDSRIRAPGGKRICTRWKTASGKDYIKYTPISDMRSAGWAVETDETTLPDGRTAYDFDLTQVSTEVSLPPSVGGQTTPVSPTTGSLRVALEPSDEFPGYNEVELLLSNFTTPPTTLPGIGAIGASTFQLLTHDYGWHSTTNGQFAVAYYGQITNPTLGTINTYSLLTGVWQPGSGVPVEFEFDTATALLLSSETTNAVAELTVTTPPVIGTTATLQSSSPLDGGAEFAVLFGVEREPRYPLPDGRTIPIAYDSLTALSLNNLPPFSNSIGVLDPSGSATTHMSIPLEPTLIGTQFFASLTTWNSLANFDMMTASNPVLLTIE